MTTIDPDRGGELAEVHYISPPQPEPAGEVLEGPVLTVKEYERIQRAQAIARRAEYKRTAVTAAQHASYVKDGAVLVARRIWQSKTRYQRVMDELEAAKDWDRLDQWECKAEAAKKARHDRRMDRIKHRKEFLLAAATRITLVVLALIVLGGILAIAGQDPSMILAPLMAIINTIRWTYWLVTSFFLAITATVIVGFLAWLWSTGRKVAGPTVWAKAPSPVDGNVMDQLPDEGMVLTALKHTGVTGFNRALKEGWKIQWYQPPMPDGRGWSCEFALPPAAPVEEFVKRKGTLAHNLRRFEREVWLTEPRASVLRLWIADPGVLTGPVDPWPLLNDLDHAETDYFAGIPVGYTLRGDLVKGRLFEANHVYGGMMGSGKSSLAITHVLGAMLDPLVDIDVVVMAENADYEPMRPRLRSLVTGAPEKLIHNGSTVAEHTMALLHSLYKDLAIRGAALRDDHDQPASSRELALKDPRLRPRLVIIDECQNLFLGDDGEDALEIAVKVKSTARKYGVTLMFLTPEPSNGSLPRKLVSIASHKACFAIGDQTGNDAVLGTGSYKVGISAVGLEPKTEEGPGDVGTCMQRGFTAKPGLMRCCHVSQSDKHRVTARAMQLREQRQAEATERRDLLADVLEAAQGEDAPRAADMAVRLREKWPRHQPYQELTGEALVEQLEALGVKRGGKGGIAVVRTERVRYVMAEREMSDDED